MRKILAILLFVSALFADKTIVVKVEKIHCPLCTAIVRKASLKVDGVKSAKADMKSKILTIQASDDVDENEILKALEATEYPGVIIK
ncbi:heavy-metal-associated domain-containing protein [Campylobacter suis]|uniref:HMA domain-containing protein n=1 Tax=Campylobacter suis TaxID=2790657 RepID=A0ABM8Q1Q4_9BACT|nr:heavy-metal-associated domain-containing protein [Campylobacter suis]CAD7286694.1 hypothetical protein LMG8286_00490 [Campylobacter suis]